MRISVAVVLVNLLLPLSATGAGPTLEDFFREMLTSGPTEITPQFNAYYEDAFHVDKQELLDSFPTFARQAKKTVRALVVLGPLGLLWTYHVVTFIREGRAIRCNALVMPHARITGKSTGLFSETDLEEFLRELDTSSLLADRGSTADRIARSFPQNDLGDFRFNILVVDLARKRVRIGEIFQSDNRRESEKFLELINRRLRKLGPTYEHGKKISNPNR